MNNTYQSIINLRGQRKYKINDIVLKVFSLFLLIFMGLRHSSIGADTYYYCKDYLMYKDYDWDKVFKLGTNYGFYIFNKLVSMIFPENQVVYLLIVASITVVSLYYFLKRNSNNIFLSEVMLLSLGFIYFFMTGIKQTLAISILLFAYEEMKKEHLVRFVLLVLLASMFHNTAIIFILVLFIKIIKFKKIILAITPIIIMLAYKYQNQLFVLIKVVLKDEYYTAYGVDYVSSSNLTGLVIQISVWSVSLLCLWRKNKLDEENLNLLSIYAVGMFFQSMTIVLAEFFRLSMYFSIFGVILLPNALQVRLFKQQKLFTMLICLVFVLYFVIFSGNDSNYIPYYFFWKGQ